MDHSYKTRTDSLAQAIHAFDASTLSQAALSQVMRAVIDTMAVSIAGVGDTSSRAAMSLVLSRRGDAAATIWSTGQRVSCEDACFVNAVSAHALDYDDVSSPMRGHPSAVLLPPLIAIAELHGSSKLEIACAYALGFETMVRIARVMVSEHYARGWHATSTLGTIGAAIASSRLLGLTTTQIGHAIGLAVAQTSGTRANFGTDAKSLQAGNSALAGMRSALLASHGMTSGDCLDGNFGFTSLFANGEVLESLTEGFGIAPLEIETSGIEIKKYPLCYATHRALDAVLSMHSEGLIDGSRVKAIKVRSNKGAHDPLLAHAWPADGTQAKFSMEYAIAAALVDGGVGLATFGDTSVCRELTKELQAKIVLSEDDGAPFPRWTSVQVVRTDGSLVERTVRHLAGGAERPLRYDELQAKVQDCFAYSKTERCAARFVAAAQQGDSKWASALLRSLQCTD